MQKIHALFKKLPIFFVILVAAILRIENLGYSDYQGDEIKAFFNTTGYSSVTDFLLSQRKGPGQFIVTFLINLINPNYTNEYIARIPFALAGVLAVFFFYKLVKGMFGEKIAFYSSLFFATNGFFVALSRIVQYQSFVILFMVMALYYLYLASTRENHSSKYFFLGILFWSFSILFHYDGVFIFPIAGFFIFKWFKKNVSKFNLKDKGAKIFVLSGILNAFIVGIFYIPFVYNLSQNTLSYWAGRMSGDVSAKISSSAYLFRVYQPIYAIHFYTLLFIVGIGFILSYFLTKTNILKKLFKRIPKFEYNIPYTLAVLVWMLVPLFFLEAIVYIPGTHIYTYLLPMTIVLAFGIVCFEKLLSFFKRFFIPEVIAYTFISILFLFLIAQSYVIYVDNKKEYPWEEEKFLIWQFHKPTPIFHLSMFGFPYYRNWEEIAKTVMTGDNNGYFSTNERKSIPRHYVPLEKDTDKAGYYIHILKPQSFEGDINQDKAAYWAERYPPVFTFSKGGDALVRVYNMEPGTLDELIEKGY